MKNSIKNIIHKVDNQTSSVDKVVEEIMNLIELQFDYKKAK